MAKAKSALFDLVGRAKACGKDVTAPDTILPLLDGFMDKLARAPRDDPDWAGIDVFHPSDVSWDFCPRLQQLKSFRPDLVAPREPAKAGLQRVFGLGSAIHDMYQNKILGPMGVLYGVWTNASTGERRVGLMPDRDGDYKKWHYVEPKTYNAAHNVGGHCDGIVLFPKRPPALLEIKSINSYGFSRLEAPLGYHMRQLQLYLHSDMPDIPEVREMLRREFGVTTFSWGLVLYHEKNQSTEKDYWVAKDPTIVEPLFAQIRAAVAGLSARELSPRLPACTSSAEKIPSACAGCSACFSAGDGAVGYTQLCSLSAGKK